MGEIYETKAIYFLSGRKRDVHSGGFSALQNRPLDFKTGGLILTEMNHAFNVIGLKRVTATIQRFRTNIMQAVNAELLSFPEDFSDHEWEVESKGWFTGALMTVSARRYRLTFFDPARLSQEIQSELDQGNVFFESNLVIVRSVTRADMELAAKQLLQSGRVDSLIPE